MLDAKKFIGSDLTVIFGSGTDPISLVIFLFLLRRSSSKKPKTFLLNRIGMKFRPSRIVLQVNAHRLTESTTIVSK